MLYAMLAACATLIFVLACRSSRGQGPSPGTPLSGTAEVGRDDGPPRRGKTETSMWCARVAICQHHLECMAGSME